MNTYCCSVATSRRIACWTCHVGCGNVPQSTMTDVSPARPATLRIRDLETNKSAILLVLWPVRTEIQRNFGRTFYFQVLYAKLGSTEVQRDWNNPNWAAGLFGGQGGFKPEEIRDSMLAPSYLWYNGTSCVFVLDQVPEQGNSAYEFGLPNRWVDSCSGLCRPKIMGPLDAESGTLSIEGGCLEIQSGTFTIG